MWFAASVFELFVNYLKFDIFSTMFFIIAALALRVTLPTLNRDLANEYFHSTKNCKQLQIGNSQFQFS